MKLILSTIFMSASLLIQQAQGETTNSVKIQLQGVAGKFDFMATDKIHARVLAAHKEAGRLEVIDSKSLQPLASVDVGEAQGVAVSPDGSQYFVGTAKEKTLVIVDAKTFKKSATISVGAPLDAIALDTKRGLIFAGVDDGDRLILVDVKNKKVIGEIKIPGVPEVLEYSSAEDRIYLNIKDKNLVVKINPQTKAIEQSLSTLPATAPHGLAIDSKTHLILVAGKNGELVAVDFTKSKVVSSAKIRENVDQIAFDEKSRKVLSACAGGISITDLLDSKLVEKGEVAIPQGAKTLALDPISGAPWVVYADQAHSYFEKFPIH